MGKRPQKPKFKPKPFESDCNSSDTSANIYTSMLMSDAFKDLTAQQITLYLYCKQQYYGEKKKPNESDLLSFTMNQSKWCGLYGLYKRTNAKGFQRDMEALINHGFIECASCGAIARQKSIYRFSDMWQKWGTPSFSIDQSVKTVGMVCRERKALEEQAKGNKPE